MTGKQKPIGLSHSTTRKSPLKKRSAHELGLYGKAAARLGVFAYLFYRSLLGFVILLPLSVVLVRQMKMQETAAQRQALAVRFKDGLLALSASLQAGHSAENAMEDAAGELAFLYGKEGRMTGEFARIRMRIGMNVPLEQAVREFAERIGLPEAECFAEVFQAARRTGGTLGSIIQETVQVIAGRLEVQEELFTMLRGRQYEQRLMQVIPLAILFYMNQTSPEFFQVLYETGIGRIVMTVCLAVYVIAAALAKRISAIEV